MGSLAKTAILICGAIMLIGPGAASSAGSQAPSHSPVAAAGQESTSVTFRAGKRNDVYQTGAVWRLKLKPGLYNAEFRATVFLQPDNPDDTSASVICAILDLNTFQSKYTRIYVADSSVELANALPAAMSGASTVRVTKDIKPGIVCFAQSASIGLYQPISATFTTLSHRTYGVAKPLPVPNPGRLAKVFGH